MRSDSWKIVAHIARDVLYSEKQTLAVVASNSLPIEVP
jgi:hypothetical protein